LEKSSNIILDEERAALKTIPKGEKRMKIRKLLFHLASLLVLASLLAACGGGATTTEAPPATEAPATEAPATEAPTEAATEAPTEAPTEAATEAPAEGAVNMDELIAAAQAEGTLTTIALPHDWCNYGAVIEGFKAKYGLEVNELDPGAGSGEELEAIRANQDNPGPQAPDVIDVGLAFGPTAKEEGLIQPYKVSTWDDIPEGAKDPDGYWYGDYYGVLSFSVNTAEVANPPAEYADLLNPEYNGQVALSGDPLTSNAAILSVWAAGLATGATGEEAARAGLDFFRQLNEAGNFVPIDGDSRTVGIGETPILIDWSYNSIANDVSLAGNPDLETVVPTEGRLAGVYVQAISAYAPHPNAAKLWMEYLYSDEGQLGWASGYCHPIRFEAMSAAGTIPEDVLAQLPSTEGAYFPTIEEIEAARTIITEGWPEVVGVTVAPSP
jgi:putative spermidine/putrescine transport system substrate-binding protein